MPSDSQGACLAIDARLAGVLAVLQWLLQQRQQHRHGPKLGLPPPSICCSAVCTAEDSPSQLVQHVCYCAAVTPSPTPHNDNDASISQRKHPQDNKRSLLLQTMPWAALTILGFVKVASTMCLAGRVVGLGPGATNAGSSGSYKLGRASNSS